MLYSRMGNKTCNHFIINFAYKIFSIALFFSPVLSFGQYSSYITGSSSVSHLCTNDTSNKIIYTLTDSLHGPSGSVYLDSLFLHIHGSATLWQDIDSIAIYENTSNSISGLTPLGFISQHDSIAPGLYKHVFTTPIAIPYYTKKYFIFTVKVNSSAVAGDYFVLSGRSGLHDSTFALFPPPSMVIGIADSTPQISLIGNSGAITGNSIVCLSSFAQFYLNDSSTSGAWGVSDTNIATSFGYGSLQAIDTGIFTLSDTTSGVCGTLVATKTITVSPNVPNIAAITGDTVVCTGQTDTLHDATPGGSWSSANTSLFTINAVTGIVTAGTTAGKDLVFYTISNPCYTEVKHRQFEIDTVPVFTTANLLLCTGIPDTLKPLPSVSHHLWHNTDTTLAKLNILKGIILPSGSGIDTVTYSLINGCGTNTLEMFSITMNPSVAIDTPVSARSVICSNTTDTLISNLSGGKWQSSLGNPVDSNVLTGLYSGVDTLFYYLKTGCYHDSIIVTVNAYPVSFNQTTFACNGDSTSVYLYDSVGNPMVHYHWLFPMTGYGQTVSNGWDSINTFVAHNPSDTQVQLMLIDTPIVTNIISCSGLPDTNYIYFNPSPTPGIVSPLAFCNGTYDTISFTNTSEIYNFYSINFSGDSSIIYDINYSSNYDSIYFISKDSLNFNDSFGVTILPTDYNTGCSGNSINKTIRINPTPAYQGISDSVRHFCDGASVKLILADSLQPFTSCIWQFSDQSVANAIDIFSDSVKFVATDTNIYHNDSFSIIITPVIGLCSAVPLSLNAVVLSHPTIHIRSDTSCYGTTHPAILLRGSDTSCNYAWSIIGSSKMGLDFSDSMNINSFSVVNDSTTIQSDTIQIIAYNQGCHYPIDTTSFSVFPKFTMTTFSKYICNNSPIDMIHFSDSNRIKGVNFAWQTIINAATEHLLMPAGVNTSADTGSFPYIDFVLNQDTVRDNIIIQLNYHLFMCRDSLLDTLVVNPTPVINQLPDTTFLNGQLVGGIALTGQTSIIDSYKWQNNLHRYTAGFGQFNTIAGIDSLPAFMAVDTTYHDIIDSIIITPFINSCYGTSMFVVDTIRHIIFNQLSNTQTHDTIVCNRSALNFIQYSAATRSEPVSYSWQSLLYGVSYSADSTCPFTFNNLSDTVQKDRVIVTPYVHIGADSVSGLPDTVYVNCYPKPAVDSIFNISVCNGAPISTVFFHGSTGSYNKYFWLNSNTAIGLNSNGLDSVAQFYAADTSNYFTDSTILSYGAFIQDSGAICNGDTLKFKIFVNPTPSLQILSPDTICSGSTIVQAILCNSCGTNNLISYSWSRNSTGESISPPTNSGSADTINESLINYGGQPLSVAYSYTVSLNGCDATGNVSDLVNPPYKPTISFIDHPSENLINLSTDTAANAASLTIYQKMRYSNFKAITTADTTNLKYRWRGNNVVFPEDTSLINSSLFLSANAIVSFTDTGLATVYLDAWYTGGKNCISSDTVNINVLPTSPVLDSLPEIVLFPQGTQNDFTTLVCLDSMPDDAYLWGYDDKISLKPNLLYYYSIDSNHYQVNQDLVFDNHIFNISGDTIRISDTTRYNFWVQTSFNANINNQQTTLVQKTYFNGLKLQQKHSPQIKSGSAFSLNIYPNPVSEYINLKIADSGLSHIYTIKILDENGILNGNYQTNEQNLSINLGNLAAGSYFIICGNDRGETISKKFIKK